MCIGRERGEIMPRSPKKPCAYPGCPRLTHDRFCEEHTKATNKQYERFERPYKSSERYGGKWRAVRDRYIQQHPICEDCIEYGIFPPGKSQEVHHIKPKSQGGTDHPDNLRALCKSCHSRHTAAEGDRWHTGQRIVYRYGRQSGGG